MRQVIISVVGLLIIAAGYFGYEHLSSTKKPEREKPKKTISTVFTQLVKNGNTPITVTASGNLAARDRIEIFSEVQGIFEHSDKMFKPGVRYADGDVLIRLNSEELRANLRSQKSNLYNQLVGMLPDLKFDYPASYDKWQAYVNAFDENQLLKPLPKPSSDREKLFVAGNNVASTWYTIKNSEERLTKYNIYAPFSGVLTEASIDKGALVRAGQKLGEFINPNLYELEVALNSSYVDLLKVGGTVTLNNVERTKTWSGRITRINSLVNPNTQTIQAFIQVNGSGLREGMYLEADLKAKNEANTFEVSRKLIVDNKKVFVVKGDILELIEIEPVHFTDKTAVIRGLDDDAEILERMLPGAFDGMQIKRFEK